MQQGESSWLIMHGCNGAPAGREIIELYDLAFLINLVQKAAGSQWRPPAVLLQANALPEGLAAVEVGAGNIRYLSTMTAIAIPEALLAAPMSNYRPSVVTETDFGRSNLVEADFATSLRLLLTGHLDECITIDDCADMVGMSSRTLQRRLAEHDTSFNEILDQTRFDLATQLLLNQSIRITDIAGELGYQDSANFSRAFRRWAGVSPRKHRRLLAHAH